ncbi:hypothetical protein HA402_015533 [Bradysia odoriphaga]|nr:hypothetical protein HA402_015533 [Bradysia odoriphaga]
MWQVTSHTQVIVMTHTVPIKKAFKRKCMLLKCRAKVPIFCKGNFYFPFFMFPNKTDETIAENPFLTQRPEDIYETTKVDVESMFGSTSLESLALLVAYPMYFWFEPLKDNYSNIGLPFNGLTLSPNSSVYQEAVQKIYTFYFGHQKLEDLQANEENFINYFEMSSDINFVHPVNKSFELHSKHAKTSRYVINLNLKLNVVKLQAHIEHLPGMSHAEDILYLFLSKKYAHLYANVLANPNDPINKKTLNALQFVPKVFTDYCKTGLPMPNVNCNAGIEITNDGVKPMDDLQNERIEFWDSIYDSVRPWL